MNQLIMILDESLPVSRKVKCQQAKEFLQDKGIEILIAARENLHNVERINEIIADSPLKRPSYLSFVIFSNTSFQLRINVWQTEYIKFLEKTPTVHTHNWDMVSMPFTGSLVNYQYETEINLRGDFSKYIERGGVGTGSKDLIGECDCKILKKTDVIAKETYIVKKGEFHAVIPSLPQTATICLQFNKDKSDRFLCLKNDFDVSSYNSAQKLRPEDFNILSDLIKTSLR